MIPQTAISSVPFIDLRHELGFEEAVLARWTKALKDRAFIGGIASQEQERLICQYCETEHFIGCANGTDAMQLALRAVGVGTGDLVVLPDFTFWATYEAVINVGAVPVLVDVDEADLQMDFALFEQACALYKPKAALIVHLYGWSSRRLLDFRALCAKLEIPLVEDGAQALGSEHLGEKIFAGALIASTSFYPAKVLGAAGDAGGIFTRDKELAERCLKLGNHGRSSHYGHDLVGWNSRLDELQAHYLVESLARLDSRIQSRKDSLFKYEQFFAGQDASLLPLSFLAEPTGTIGNGYLQVSLCKTNYAELAPKLKAAGIGTGNVYPSSISAQPGIASGTIIHAPERKANHLAQRILNLPLFPYMLAEELAYVFRVLATLPKS